MHERYNENYFFHFLNCIYMMKGEIKEKAKQYPKKKRGDRRETSQENPSVGEVEPNFFKSSLYISYDERMQIILLILISTCIFTILFYGYLRTLPNSSLPIGLRKAIGMSLSPDGTSYRSSSLSVLLSRSFELIHQLSVKVSRVLILLPSVTSAPYIWSRKKSRKAGSTRSQGY